MKITLVQSDIVWCDPEANQKKMEALLPKAGETDIIVMPEMWSTGFAVEPEGIAESADGTSLHWMRNTARERHCAVAGSVVVEDGGKFFNRFYFVKSDGTTAAYDKHHLFTYGGENKHFTAGNRRVVVSWGGVRILLQVCYDLRFPVFSRNHEDYDMILYVASWPTSRVDAWLSLLKARAIENQCYVAGVNRVGTDPACAYCGGTVLYDAYGRVVVRCPENEVSVVTAELDMKELERFRTKFPVLKDADKQ
jgi:omega-amidase